MQTEHGYYHVLTDGPEMGGYTEAVSSAKVTKVGRRHTPTIADARAIEAGISTAVAGRLLANK